MSFLFSELHLEEYRAAGYTVFRRIVPASLLQDLRDIAPSLRRLARERYGPEAQRLQPVFATDLDHHAFESFRDLPELRDSVVRLLTPQHVFGTRDYLGALIEPSVHPWCTQWHRDWRDNSAVPRDEWEPYYRDPELFNQLNAAVFEDTCTWAVPGSHARPDTPRETARFPTRPIEKPALEGESVAERERRCLEYCESMPGAVRLHLDPGDVLIYRNTLWHLGNYTPSKQRMTLHDVLDTPRFTAWRENAKRLIAEASRQRSQVELEG
jgi:hypothetical protein